MTSHFPKIAVGLSILALALPVAAAQKAVPKTTARPAPTLVKVGRFQLDKLAVPKLKGGAKKARRASAGRPRPHVPLTTVERRAAGKFFAKFLTVETHDSPGTLIAALNATKLSAPGVQLVAREPLYLDQNGVQMVDGKTSLSLYIASSRPGMFLADCSFATAIDQSFQTSWSSWDGTSADATVRSQAGHVLVPIVARSTAAGGGGTPEIELRIKPSGNGGGGFAFTQCDVYSF